MLGGQQDPSWEAPTWSQQKWPGCLENWPVLRLWAMHIIQYSMADPRSIETHQMILQDWLEHNKAAENIDILTEKCKFTTHDWLIQRWFNVLVTKLAKLAHITWFPNCWDKHRRKWNQRGVIAGQKYDDNLIGNGRVCKLWYAMEMPSSDLSVEFMFTSMQVCTVRSLSWI